MLLSSLTKFTHSIKPGHVFVALCAVTLVLPVFASAQKREDLILPKIVAYPGVVKINSNTKVSWTTQKPGANCTAVDLATGNNVSNNSNVTITKPAHQFEVTCTLDGKTEKDTIPVSAWYSYPTPGVFIRAYPNKTERSNNFLKFPVDLDYKAENVAYDYCKATENNKSLTLNPVPSPKMTTQIVYPEVDTEYTLSCPNAEGTPIPATTKVCLLPEVEVSYSGDNPIKLGVGMRLQAHAQNYTKCKANFNFEGDYSNLDGTKHYSTFDGLNKYQEIVGWLNSSYWIPQSTKTYTLICENKCGFNYDSVTVEVSGGTNPNGPGGNGGGNINNPNNSGARAASASSAQNITSRITTPVSGEIVTGSTYEVSGVCSPGTQLSVIGLGARNQIVTCNTNGSFSASLAIRNTKVSRDNAVIIVRNTSTRKIEHGVRFKYIAGVTKPLVVTPAVPSIPETPKNQTTITTPAVIEKVSTSTSCDAPTEQIPGIIRDFSVPGSRLTSGSFERSDFGPLYQIQDTIGSDKKPVFKKASLNGTREEFDQWYSDTTGVNQSKSYSINLTDVDGDGIFTYSNNEFFPIDNQLYGNEGRRHNYHFTYELHSNFTAKEGAEFTFVGDDDLWVFINGKKIIDLGGVHPPKSTSFALDGTTLQKFGLAGGGVYPIDIFFAERHTVQSNFSISTSLALEGGCNPVTTDPVRVPPQVSLVASPKYMEYGKGTTLTWKSENVTSCTSRNFSTKGELNGSTYVPADYTIPNPVTEFEITCIGKNGEQVKSQDSVVYNVY